MKKTILFFLVSLMVINNIKAQEIPNYSFENWEGGVPVNWFTSNLLNIYVPVTQSTDARTGTYAVHGVVLPAGNTGYSPLISAGIDAKGFPVTNRPLALHGWYKFNSDSGDAFTVSVVVVKNRKAIGSGGFYSTEIHSGYTEFTANIIYNSPDTPDTAQIVILIANSGKVHSGSTYTLDDLSFSIATDINEPDKNEINEFTLEQNYPNPFNPSTVISYQLPVNSFVSLKIYDVLGGEIVTLAEETKTEGYYEAAFDGSSLASGTYIYRLTANSIESGEVFVKSAKMLMIK